MLLCEPPGRKNPALLDPAAHHGGDGRDAGLAAVTDTVPAAFRRNAYAAMRFRPRHGRKATP